MACEAAFIGHAILRNPTLFGELPEEVRQGVWLSMNKTYELQPKEYGNNWVNFPSIMQAGLWKAGLSNETNWIPIAAKQ